MAETAMKSLINRSIGSGINNEGSLHSGIKEWYALPGDRFEVRINGYIVDLVRASENYGTPLLIEIQTTNFTALRRKLSVLLKSHPVHLVYPIAREKWITRITPAGERIGSRKSPKTGQPIEVFNELVRIPDFINDENFTLELLMIKVEEIRCADGRGSWRRGGVSIKERRLLEVCEQIRINNRQDLLKFLPADLPQPFSNKLLARCLGRSVHMARKLTYCLKKTGVIMETGKKGNELLFEISLF